MQPLLYRWPAQWAFVESLKRKIQKREPDGHGNSKGKDDFWLHLQSVLIFLRISDSYLFMCISYIHNSKGWAFHNFVHFVLQKDIHRPITIDYINARGLFHGAETFVSVSSLHRHFSRGVGGGEEGQSRPRLGGRGEGHPPRITPYFHLPSFIFPTPSEDKKRTCKHAIQTCIMIYFKAYTGSTMLIL